ncbi:MAG: hypothetical protein JNM00_09300, partial [Flavobacteriales bacterium]|nr:hypothetical protein [Flavobacteriales bacterium]
MRNRFITAAFILISFINLNAQKADKLTQKRLATIDLLCQKALSEFNVPGMAVGIV